MHWTLALIVGLLMAANPCERAAARATISDDVVRIGLLLDMSGPYSDYSGEGAATAARMAVSDFGGTVLGKPVEVLAADHLNKPDIASSRAREWFDNGKVDAILETIATGPALAVLEIAKQKNKIVAFSGPGAVRLTNESCSPISIHYALDSYALTRATVKALTARGLDSWHILALDSVFGADLIQDAGAALADTGGKLVGTTRHPLATTDFSSFLVAAQSSGAKVIALANAGNDTANALKTAREFGIGVGGKQRMASLYTLINDINAIGVEGAQGLIFTEAFYWNRNEQTRAWSRRFYETMKRMPNAEQAAVYSTVLHYLGAVKQAGTDETGAVMKQMRERPINDIFATNGRIREDGRMVHDMYLVEVKKPSEVKEPWDLYNVLATIPGDEAFQPLSRSRCPLVKK
ncbi:ABC transporter substrate-binding protein [Bosea robiniae]|uniref:Branched-chain amino acid transport system substrate-binding protein n=1 Tax=Bosea robiniae TaxID=1036780 RepID=A0ABY0P4C4_9HYPH|nr:ABC transporter substrate-binding protein [Bosea robiniae]SDH24403.1 branched-chain amino acid transport system substrate-binding protein [Bosea robiniae]